MRQPLPMALVQAPAWPGSDFAEFSSSLEQLVRTSPHVSLVVYPELHLCADLPVGGAAAAMEATAEPLDGPRDRALAELAGDLGIWLAPGTVYERGADNEIFNTVSVYSPQGRRIAYYRKIFPWRPFETTTPGSQFVVFDMAGFGRVGLSICYDAWFPEHARHLAWMGAELVLNLVRTPTVDRAQETVLARATAITNQVFIGSVNAAGPDGLGRSLLVDPEGSVLSEARGDESVVLDATVDLAEVTKVREYGTAGLNRMWSQFQPEDTPLSLPLYGGQITPDTWNSGHGPHASTSGAPAVVAVSAEGSS